MSEITRPEYAGAPTLFEVLNIEGQSSCNRNYRISRKTAPMKLKYNQPQEN